jgi:NTE family protein
LPLLRPPGERYRVDQITVAEASMPITDLVLEGGGVKGTGLAGAITALAGLPDPYTFNRVAGTSAGAIVASFVAAGVSVADLKTIMIAQDFATFEDESPALEHFKELGAVYREAKKVSEGIGLLAKEGLFRGDALHAWIAATLAAHGVTTWADLKIDDDSLPPNERYKLVVVVSDVSRGRELRLPWDYDEQLGVDPDKQLVADAVRSSDYPIDIFDRQIDPRWPTIGIKLSAREQVSDAAWSADENDLDLAKALLSTMINSHDQLHVEDPYYSSRTIFVDTTGFSSTNFQLTNANKLTMFDNGMTAGNSFLSTWNYEAWRKQYPARAPRPPVTGSPAPGSSA